MLTLVQTKKTRKKFPILLFGSDFWKSLLNLDVMHEWGMISPEDDQLYKHVDSVEEARDFLIAEMARLYLSPDGRQRE
jgi:predicted Rossmann-fold nucleotide-binding protein